MPHPTKTPVRPGCPEHQQTALFIFTLVKLSKFTGDTKLDGSADLLEGRKGLQKDLDRPDEQPEANSIRFSNMKCQVLHLG